jgi:hypothetical protein
MAPTRALAKIRLLVGTTGGTSTGDEDMVVREVRDRLKLLGDERDLKRVRLTLDYAAHPLVGYMQKVFPTVDLESKTKGERAELFFELLKQACSHTKHIARLALVVDDDGEWNAFEDRLELQFQGTAPARPASATPPVVASATRTTVPPPWWSRKWFYVGVAFTAVISYAYVGSHYEMGRDRAMAVFKAAVGLAVVLLMGRVGPDALLEGTVEETDAQTAQQAPSPDDDSSSDGGSQSASRRGPPASPRAPTSAEAEALQKLQQDTQPAVPAGFMSQAPIPAPPGLPGLPASVLAPAAAPAGAWAPATLATRAQANYLGDLFNHFEGQQSVNPLWCAEFWAKISELQAQQTLSPDLGRLLAKHGYFGAGTTAPPRADFRGELRALADTGAPAMALVLAPCRPFQPLQERLVPRRRIAGTPPAPRSWIDAWDLATEWISVFAISSRRRMIKGCFGHWR